MKDHRQFRDALSALHDGELGTTEREEVLAHLRECEECREKYQRWENIARLVFRAPAAPAAGDTEMFVQRVMGRLDPHGVSVSTAPSAWWEWLGARWLIPALSAGVAALFFSIARYSPESAAPLDALLLVDAHSRSVNELIYPSDPSHSVNVLDFDAEDG